MAQLLPRFWDVDAGRIVVDGVDLRDLELRSLRAAIGVVTQETVLFNTTVRANIAYGQDVVDEARLAACARAAFAEEFIREMPQGYDTVVGEAGVKLSGGQRQRLAVARALYKDPPLLILDEATSALDAEAEGIVQRALENLLHGRTTLMIAHRLATVRAAGDHRRHGRWTRGRARQPRGAARPGRPVRPSRGSPGHQGMNATADSRGQPTGRTPGRAVSCELSARQQVRP